MVSMAIARIAHLQHLLIVRGMPAIGGLNAGVTCGAGMPSSSQ